MFKVATRFYQYVVKKYQKYRSRNNLEVTTDESKSNHVTNVIDVTTVIQPVSQHCDPDFIDLTALDDMFNFDKILTLEFLPAFKKEPKKVYVSKSSRWTKNIELHGLDFIHLFIKDGERNLYSPNNIMKNYVLSSIDLIIDCDNYFFCVVCKMKICVNFYFLTEHIFQKNHIKYLTLVQNNHCVDKYNFHKCTELIWFAKNCISVKTHEWSYCHACKLKFSINDIQLHLQDRNHIDKYDDLYDDNFKSKLIAFVDDIWYYTQFFNCTLCYREFHTEIQFLEHLTHKNHEEKVGICTTKGDELEFQVCFACVTGFFGVREKYYEHCQDIYHKRYLKKGDFNVPEMRSPTVDLLDKIENKKRRLINESNLVVLECTQEKNILKEVKRVVECVYPKAVGYIFGSRCSHTALSNSDLDIFLDCNDGYYKNVESVLVQSYLSSVRKCFENHKDEWYIEEVIVDASTPIIKLRHYPTSLKCDISFSNGLSHRKSKLVRHYNDAYPMCRELILYLKKWMTFSQLSGTEGISTFTVSWLVIFYLQHKGVFPSVYELIKKQTRTILIDGWECGYQENICIKSNKFSFVEHLVGLFTFYAKFDYQKYVICPYLGTMIEKEKFAARKLPSRLTDKLSNRKKEAVSLFRFDSPMCMQDPTDLSENSTKALRKRQLRCFREYCSLSVEIIQSGQQYLFV